jgi:hypothetical protein
MRDIANKLKLTAAIAASGLAFLVAGCATTNVSLTRVGTPTGRTEGYIGTIEELNTFLASPKGWNLQAWDIYNESKLVGVYAEGRAYGMHFYELTNDKRMLDGCCVDGPMNIPSGYEAIPRKPKQSNRINAAHIPIML